MNWYLISLNLVTFIFYGMDKRRAIKKKQRISEYTLLVLSFFGGCLGALLGMNVFHHKTKKFKFWFFNLLFTIMWIIIVLKR